MCLHGRRWLALGCGFCLSEARLCAREPLTVSHLTHLPCASLALGGACVYDPGRKRALETARLTTCPKPKWRPFAECLRARCYSQQQGTEEVHLEGILQQGGKVRHT